MIENELKELDQEAAMKLEYQSKSNKSKELSEKERVVKAKASTTSRHRTS